MNALAAPAAAGTAPAAHVPGGFAGPGLPQRLGELLLERGLLAAVDLQRALTVQAQVGGRLGQVLVRLGALSEETLLPVLVEQLGIPALSASDWPQDATALRLPEGFALSPDWCIDQGVVAWALPDGDLRLVVARDPIDAATNEVLDRRLPAPWAWRLARAQDVERLLDAFQRANRAATEDDDDIGHLRELAEEAPVIVKPKALRRISTIRHRKADDLELHYFLLEVERELSPRLNHEHSRYGWFKRRLLPSRFNLPTNLAIEHGLLDKGRR